MEHLETTYSFEVQKKLDCQFCQKASLCEDLQFCFNLMALNKPVCTNLICTLDRALYVVKTAYDMDVKIYRSTAFERARQIFKMFLPAINNALKATFKLEWETLDDTTKAAVIKMLGQALDDWDLLQFFDITFAQDIEINYLFLSGKTPTI